MPTLGTDHSLPATEAIASCHCWGYSPAAKAPLQSLRRIEVLLRQHVLLAGNMGISILPQAATAGEEGGAGDDGSGGRDVGYGRVWRWLSKDGVGTVDFVWLGCEIAI